MKRRSQTDEEQSAERFTKLLARREACAKGAAKGRRLQHAGASERSEATRRERSYRMNADAAMTWPLYQYALWFAWDIIPGRVWH